MVDGTELGIAATPADGYRFSKWTGSPDCEGLTDAALSLSLSRDVSCTAAFVRIFQVTGTIAGADGTVGASSPSGATCDAGACTVDVGGEVILVAPSLPDHRFTGWSGDATCSGTAPTLDL